MEYIKTVQNNSNSSSHIDVLKEELEEMCRIDDKDKEMQSVPTEISTSLLNPTTSL
jgi:hypothetical protein